MLARIIARMDAGVSADLEALRSVAYGGGRMPLELIAALWNCFRRPALPTPTA